MTFQVGMAKDALGLIVDGEKYGWSPNDVASLVTITGFAAMPLATQKVAKKARAQA